MGTFYGALPNVIPCALIIGKHLKRFVIDSRKLEKIKSGEYIWVVIETSFASEKTINQFQKSLLRLVCSKTIQIQKHQVSPASGQNVFRKNIFQKNSSAQMS
jgi:hypothetical protein